ncbi:MAG: TetR/AcrR family transcriptional regulator [Lentisphaerae bacterium]|jgi:AcrR family transcriptional regulator|nr:TetR/AcrR family transcriptional regulator [Lentisphaerota bacterium]
MATTQEKILTSACEVFAQHGYRAAKTQDICSLADANVAAISYYFRGKANLYLAVWEDLFQGEAVRLNREMQCASDAREKLCSLIRISVLSIAGDGRMSCFAKIVHHETSSPSPLHLALMGRYLEPIQAWFKAVIADYLAPLTDDKTLKCCLLCVHGPLLDLMNFRLKWERLQQDSILRQHPLYNLRPAFMDNPEPLIEQMQKYILGGLDAFRNSAVPAVEQ